MERRGYGAAFGAHLLWGLAPIYWKQVGSIAAGQLTALRFVQTFVLLGGYLWIANRRSPRDLFADRRVALGHLAAGCLLAVNWLVFVYAVSTERVVDLSLGYFLNPLASVVLGMVFLGERLHRRSWFAVAMSAAGVGVMAVEAGALPWISLVVAASFGLYGLVKKLSPSDPVEGVAVEMLWIAPAAAGYLMWLAANGAYETGDDPTFALTFLIGVVAAAPLLLFARAARTIPLWALGLMQYIGPTLQFVLGVAVYGEDTSVTRMIGFAVIWTGLAVFAHDSWPRDARQGSVAEPASPAVQSPRPSAQAC